MTDPQGIKNSESASRLIAPERTQEGVMNRPHLLVLGVWLVRPIERISVAAKILGISRSTAYRLSADWPLAGPATSRFVIMVPWLEMYHLTWAVEPGEPIAISGNDGSSA